MPQVYLIMRRTDILDGVLQAVDLWPNTSSKNYVYPPGLGQTGYVHNILAPAITGLTAAGPPVTALTDLTGVAAYLIGNIDTGAVAGGAPFTDAEADAAAAALVAIAQAGTVLDAAAVDAALAAVVAATTLSGGGSTGVLTDLLAVMAGNVWLVPAGSALSDGAGLFAGQVGLFVEGTYKQLYDTGQFLVSNLNGNVSLLKSPAFTYDNTLGAAVTVYSSTGTLL